MAQFFWDLSKNKIQRAPFYLLSTFPKLPEDDSARLLLSACGKQSRRCAAADLFSESGNVFLKWNFLRQKLSHSGTEKTQFKI